MGAERRDNPKRAETLQRFVLWISQTASPVRDVPPRVIREDIGRRILKRLAFRGLVRKVGDGWAPTSSLLAPHVLQPVAHDTQPHDAQSPPNEAGLERRNQPRLRCPKCHKMGFVRHENVVKGIDAERHFICGSCEHSWRIKDVRTRLPRLPPPKADNREYRRRSIPMATRSTHSSRNSSA